MDKEDKLLIEEILYEEGTQALLRAIFGLAEGMEKRILTHSTHHIDEKFLFLEKARAEGAKELAHKTERMMEELKAKMPKNRVTT